MEKIGLENSSNWVHFIFVLVFNQHVDMADYGVVLRWGLLGGKNQGSYYKFAFFFINGSSTLLRFLDGAKNTKGMKDHLSSLKDFTIAEDTTSVRVVNGICFYMEKAII